jgi:predicted ATP-dependent protease
MSGSAPTPPPSPTPSPDGWRLRPEDLQVRLDPEALGFRTTDEVGPLDHVVGQGRALRALEFGLSVRHRGYNLYVSGMTGTGRKNLLRRLLEARARQEPTPDDWVYVHNFDEPDRPLALRLPPGHGARLRGDLEEAIERLRHDLPAALKAKDFDAERDRLAGTYGKRSEELFNELTEHARRLELAIRQLPNGVFVFVPLREGRPLEPKEVEGLSPDERAEVEHRQEELGQHAAEVLGKQQELSRELHHEVEGIVRDFARRILDPLIDRVKGAHPGGEVADWLDRIREHLLDHLERLHGEGEEAEGVPSVLRAAARRDPLQEYRVNVVADNARTEGAPVVIEISPTYKNLFGTVEHDVNLFGRVSTDFTHIKPGSVLRASGGYLVFDLADALTEPLVWKQLKRTIKSSRLLTEAYEPLGLLASTAIKPQPIPVDLKVIAVGPTELYYLLQFVDDDFSELFRVRADFGPEMTRDEAGQRDYAAFVARLVRDEGLPPFAASGVAEVIRFGAREAGHKEKLSVEFGRVADLIREAGHWARAAGAAVVDASHVRQAIEERAYRSGRLADKVHELIGEGTLRISVEGDCVGQVNGLSVIDLGDYRFGRPGRVTASVGIGQDGIVNIERESALSGSTHDKGVLILEGYLRNRYTRSHPLALSAALTFEQSYGWVEGDSASSAELYCLLSALADVPLRQDVAVTGSVNQHGEVQAVGGVNEKVEGFFDVCRLKGLTGRQGVCLPRSNVPHLMPRPDVVEAVRAGQFHLWAIDSIDEGIELLTGMPAGDLDREGTFHYRLDQRLREILRVLQEEPVPGGAPRVHLATGAPPPPSPPPLPGSSGDRVTG